MGSGLRMLFVAAGSPATVFALVPLATAARNAGHDVFVAATEEMTPVVVGAGLPAVSLTGRTMREYMFIGDDGARLTLPTEPTERMRFGGHGFGRLASDGLENLRALSDVWRPDIVVGGTLSFAAPLLARHLGVPVYGTRGTWASRWKWTSERPNNSRGSFPGSASPNCPSRICGSISAHRVCSRPTRRPVR